VNDRAANALNMAEATADPVRRRLWVVAAIDALLSTRMVIVGGAAVDLFTGSYRPTDIDLIGSVSREDRETLAAGGFTEVGSRHVAWTATDGETVLVEFPASSLESDFDLIELAPGVTVAVITLEGLVVDRLIQATHPNSVSFDDAVALVAAVAEGMDWAALSEIIRARPEAAFIGLLETTADVLDAAGLSDKAALFGS